MSLSNTLPTAAPRHEAGTHQAVLWSILVTEVLILCLPAKWWGIAGLSLITIIALFCVIFAVLRGRGEGLIIGWVVIFPLGYYFLSFPRERSLITLDRVLIAILLASACFAARSQVTRIPRVLGRSAACWALFLLFAAIAIPRAKTPLNSLRVWIEAFLLPALLAWYVLRYADVRRYLPALHAVTCVMAIYVACIGASEIFLQRDLLPLSETAMYVAGDPAEASSLILLRPNGPFSTNNSFAMIGVVSFIFLLFLKTTFVEQMPTWQRILHRLGSTAALTEALMPLFKSVLVSFAAVLLLDAYYQHGRRRALRVAAILSLGLAILLPRLLLPSVFEERSDPVTLYARIAQERQTLGLFMDHPINGVGLNNFYNASQNSKYLSYYKTAEALDSPHNNIGAVLAETGLTGILPFLASQVFFVSAFWKLRRANSQKSQLVWKTFIFLFLCFWINGLSLTIIYFGDLNLWYMLVLAVVYKFAITTPGINFSRSLTLQ